jgi:excisionase family DNA binding protein
VYDPKFLNELAHEIASRIKRDLQPQNGNALQPRLLTVEKASEYLGRSKSSVEKLIFHRKIPVVRVGRRVHLDRLDLDRVFIDGNKE